MKGINSDGVATFATGITFTILATCAVLFRFVAKKMTKSAFGADDGWIIVSLIAYYANTGDTFWGVFAGGGGANIQTIVADHSFSTLTRFLKSMLIILPVSALAVTACKFSILCIYRRLFVSATSYMGRATLILGLLCTAWFLTVTLGGILSCLPLDRFWDPTVPGFCINVDIFFLSFAIIEIIIDTVILTLPVGIILNLKMAKNNKLALIFIFLLGAFVIISNIVRTALVYVPGGFDVSFTKAQLWFNIHMGTGIICACLPTFRPIVTKLGVLSSSFRDRYGSMISLRRWRGSQSGPSHVYGSDGPESSESYSKLGAASNDNAHLTNITVGPSEKVRNTGYSSKAIEVTSTVDIV